MRPRLNKTLLDFKSRMLTCGEPFDYKGPSLETATSSTEYPRRVNSFARFIMTRCTPPEEKDEINRAIVGAAMETMEFRIFRYFGGEGLSCVDYTKSRTLSWVV